MELDNRGGGHITIGKNCEIHSGAKLITFRGDIEIGNDCSLNDYSIIYGHGGVKIGNFVRIAAHCVIIPANHTFELLNIPISNQILTAKGIIINDDVWIGTNVTILDGVTIGKGVVIGAGSVVVYVLNHILWSQAIQLKPYDQ